MKGAIPSTAPPLDLRTQNSAFSLLLLLCISPAWFGLYSRAVFISNRTFRPLRNRFCRSLRQLLAAAQLCLTVFSGCCVAYGLKHSSGSLKWLTLVVSGATTGFSVAGAYRTSSHNPSGFPLALLTVLSLATHSGVIVWHAFGASRTTVIAAVGTIMCAGVIATPNRRFPSKMITLYALAGMGAFISLGLGMAPIVATLSALFGFVYGYFQVPFLPLGPGVSSTGRKLYI